MRTAGATGRAMLMEAAAQNRWGVHRVAVSARTSGSSSTRRPTKLSYGSVAEMPRKLPVPTNVKVKDPKDFTIIGTNVKRLDTRAKSTGKRRFRHGRAPRGMLYAVMTPCPVFGSKVASTSTHRKRKLCRA